MPGYKEHILGGIAIGGLSLGGIVWAGFYLPDLKTAMLWVGIACGAALFPDTDTDSKGQNWFYAVLLLIDAGLMFQRHYEWAALLGFCAMLPAVGRHRGWTHTWWAMLAIPIPILLVPIYLYQMPLEKLIPFYFAAVVGYFSHLLLDGIF